MRTRIFSMFALSLLLLGSCNKLEIIETPVQTGDEISFGFTAPGKVETRTVYGEPYDNDGNPLNYFPVYWEQDDEIAIYCPQASQPASKLVTYKITPDVNNPATSSAVTKKNENEAGLQWGKDEEHRFYGFYPALAVKGTETDGRIMANVPVNQQVVEWQERTDKKTGGKVYDGKPNTDFAYMFGYTAVNKSQMGQGVAIPLKFNPLLTILEIEVNGPKSGSAIKVSNVNVTGVEGIALAGDFECLISDRKGTCKPLGDDKVTNRVSISCFNEKTNNFITLQPGEKLIVKAFIIPNDEKDGAIKPRKLSVTVSTLNGAAKTKTLQTDDILPHKVNRVSLPALTSGGTNYWMSNLDPNIYLSELSIPGSKFSALYPGSGANPLYQNVSIEQQFMDGTRAFILQTETKGHNQWYPPYNFIYDGMQVAGGKGKTLTKSIKEIASYLEKCQNDSDGKGLNEFAFVQITYNGGDSPSGYTSEQYWIDRLNYEINNIKNNPVYRIYNGEITPKTTIADVAGKIILKANYNSEEMLKKYNGNAPILFSYWKGFYGPKNSDKITYYQDDYKGMPMNWQTPQWYLNATNAKLRWYYQEATNVGNNAEATKNEKETYIKKLFTESVNLYKNDTEHKTWFMNDLGGVYTSNNSTTALATDMNNLAVQELQKRGENAGLGIVFLNFSDMQQESGVKYKSDVLIQTIIDNNFKFALRKKTSEPTPAPSYDASYSNGGDAIGWDE